MPDSVMQLYMWAAAIQPTLAQASALASGASTNSAPGNLSKALLDRLPVGSAGLTDLLQIPSTISLLSPSTLHLDALVLGGSVRLSRCTMGTRHRLTALPIKWSASPLDQAWVQVRQLGAPVVNLAVALNLDVSLRFGQRPGTRFLSRAVVPSLMVVGGGRELVAALAAVHQGGAQLLPRPAQVRASVLLLGVDGCSPALSFHWASIGLPAAQQRMPVVAGNIWLWHNINFGNYYHVPHCALWNDIMLRRCWFGSSQALLMSQH